MQNRIILIQILQTTIIFFDKSNNSLIDISKDLIKIQGIPIPPKNKIVSDIELIISIKNK